MTKVRAIELLEEVAKGYLPLRKGGKLARQFGIVSCCALCLEVRGCKECPYSLFTPNYRGTYFPCTKQAVPVPSTNRRKGAEERRRYILDVIIPFIQDVPDNDPFWKEN